MPEQRFLLVRQARHAVYGCRRLADVVLGALGMLEHWEIERSMQIHEGRQSGRETARIGSRDGRV